jgi:hypothetical protein
MKLYVGIEIVYLPFEVYEVVLDYKFIYFI